MRFKSDPESVTASGDRGDHARLGLLVLQTWADPGLRERLREHLRVVRGAEGMHETNGLPGSVQRNLLKLALRAGAAGPRPSAPRKPLSFLLPRRDESGGPLPQSRAGLREM